MFHMFVLLQPDGECRHGVEKVGGQQQVAKNRCLFQLMVEQQTTLLELDTATEAQANQQLWEQVNKALVPRRMGGSASPLRCMVQPAVKVQKMTPADNPEAFLNSFEHTTTAAGWPEDQCAAILILCLVGLAQQAVDTYWGCSRLPESVSSDPPNSQPEPRSILSVLVGHQVQS